MQRKPTETQALAHRARKKKTQTRRNQSNTENF